MPGVYDSAEPATHWRRVARHSVAFRFAWHRRRLWFWLFRSSQIRDTQPTCAPVQRFKCGVAHRPHMAWGQDGSLLLSCM